MKRISLFLLAFAVVIGCGKKKDVTEAVFPTEGMTDLLKVAAGEYKLTSIKSTTKNEETKAVATFWHELENAGDITEGKDTIRRKADWGTHKSEEEIMQLTASLNLPFNFSATGEAVEFKDKHYYWHYSRSNGKWRWLSTSEEDPRGDHFYAMFANEFRNGDNAAIYENSPTKVTAVVAESTVRVYYAKTVDGTSQVVELIYQKQ